MAGHDGISGNDQSHMVFENGLRIINPFQAA
jgi:predicted nucleic acid-binding protein